MADLIEVCYREVLRVRRNLVHKYGNDSMAMMGKCIEGTDNLVEILRNKGLNAEPYQVWALYEYYEGCTAYCYEEHWIAVVKHGNKRLYLDPTFNQFQWAVRSHVLPPVYIGVVLPNWLLTREPGRKTLHKCGWTNFYNYGYGENCFDYWSYLDNPSNKMINKKIEALMHKELNNGNK